MTLTEDAVDFDGRLMEPFHIVVDEAPNGPRTQVGACINDGAKEWLRENEITDASLVVMVFQGQRVVKRYVVPLSNGLTWVTYPRAGEYTVEIALAYSESHSAGRVKSLLLKEGKDSMYAVDLHNESYDMDDNTVRGRRKGFVQGKTWHSDKENVEVKFHPHSSKRTIHVADNNFAKPMAAWRRYWLGMFFPSKKLDQCQGRRQTIMATVFTPFLVLHYLAKIIGVVGMVILGLFYENQFKHIWKPGRHGSLPLVLGSGQTKLSFWFTGRKESEFGGYRYKDRPEPVQVGVVFVAATLVLGSMLYMVSGLSYGASLGWVGTVIALVIGAIIGFALAKSWFNNRSDSPEVKARRAESKRRKQRSTEQREADELERYLKNLETMSCSPSSLQPAGKASGGLDAESSEAVARKELTLDDLIARRSKSFGVVYNRAKDGVCKPYAQP